MQVFSYADVYFLFHKVPKGRPYLIGGFNLREPTASEISTSVQILFLPQSAFQI